MAEEVLGKDGGALAASAAPAEDEDTPASLRLLIIAKGEQVRRQKAAGEQEGAAASVAALLALKARYRSVAGEEYRAKPKKRSQPPESEDAGGASRKRAKQAPLAKAVAAPVNAMEPPPTADTFPPWEPRQFFGFEVVHRSRKPGSRARVGRITTPHGVIETPAFVPVGTNGALKAIDERQSVEAGTQLMFCNTYHLLVHPGPDIIRRAGGLHRFIGHEGPIITDSGGFQVFSLAEPSSDDGPEMKSKTKTRTAREGGSASLLRVNEQGAVFRSYHDGTVIELTPESSVLAQKDFGSDIIIPLDELPGHHISRERLAQSVRLSHRWMARSLRQHLEEPRQQAMYAVVHGGTDEELRAESAEYLGSLPFDGFAIGGSLGKDRAEMLTLLEFLVPKLPADKPNHLLGIADPESAEAVVPLGIDTLDSCNPTRIARHGMLLCTSGAIKIKQGRFAADFGPIDPQCETIAHSRAYLHHLFKQHEPLFMTLASQHNLIFMNRLMADIRRRILADEL
eukprot:Transcript_9533.p1 GENE.Transcript_9533~~Transcript_9533.p1  ORF type:complete len:511 (-),score=225.51 Transcript_9533:798-2330(-)